MNPDLAMGDKLLKKTGAGNLFVVFGEPDVEIRRVRSGVRKNAAGSSRALPSAATEQLVVEVKGVDSREFLRVTFTDVSESERQRVRNCCACTTSSTVETAGRTFSRAVQGLGGGGQRGRLLAHGVRLRASESRSGLADRAGGGAGKKRACQGSAKGAR